MAAWLDDVAVARVGLVDVLRFLLADEELEDTKLLPEDVELVGADELDDVEMELFPALELLELDDLDGLTELRPDDDEDELDRLPDEDDERPPELLDPFPACAPVAMRFAEISATNAMRIMECSFPHNSLAGM